MDAPTFDAAATRDVDVSEAVPTLEPPVVTTASSDDARSPTSVTPGTDTPFIVEMPTVPAAVARATPPIARSRRGRIADVALPAVLLAAIVGIVGALDGRGLDAIGIVTARATPATAGALHQPPVVPSVASPPTNAVATNAVPADAAVPRVDDAPTVPSSVATTRDDGASAAAHPDAPTTHAAAVSRTSGDTRPPADAAASAGPAEGVSPPVDAPPTSSTATAVEREPAPTVSTAAPARSPRRAAIASSRTAPPAPAPAFPEYRPYAPPASCTSATAALGLCTPAVGASR